MKFSKITAASIAFFAAILILSGCAAAVESAAKGATEKAIEKAVKADAGEDVKVDLGGLESGKINIATSDGDIKINVDEQSGSASAVITDKDGNEMLAEAADGKAVLKDKDGNIIAEGESDGATGSLAITNDDGTKTHITAESDGEKVEWKSEGMSGSISQGGALPDGFPEHIKFADGLEVMMAQTMEEGGKAPSHMIMLSGEGDPQALNESAISKLENAGFMPSDDPDDFSTMAGIYAALYSDGKWNVELMFISEENETLHTYMVSPASD